MAGGGDVAEAEKKKVVVAPPAKAKVDVAPAKAKVDVAPAKAKGAKAAKNGDILSAVRQATLSDTEAQALIDVLLLKQVGRAAHSSGRRWMDSVLWIIIVLKLKPFRIPIRLSILMPIRIRLSIFDADPDPAVHLMPIRIRLSILMPIRIRLPFDANPIVHYDAQYPDPTVHFLCRSKSGSDCIQILHLFLGRNFFTFNLSCDNFTLFYLFRQRHRCHN